MTPIKNNKMNIPLKEYTHTNIPLDCKCYECFKPVESNTFKIPKKPSKEATKNPKINLDGFAFIAVNFDQISKNLNSNLQKD